MTFLISKIGYNYNYKPIVNSADPILNMNLTPELYLGSSILIETFATCCLKQTEYNKLWFIPIYIFYGLSFYLFPKSLQKFSLNTAYTIWCGCGIILTMLFDIIFYKELVTLKKIIGSFIVLLGVIFMQS